MDFHTDLPCYVKNTYSVVYWNENAGQVSTYKYCIVFIEKWGSTFGQPLRGTTENKSANHRLMMLLLCTVVPCMILQSCFSQWHFCEILEIFGVRLYSAFCVIPGVQCCRGIYQSNPGAEFTSTTAWLPKEYNIFNCYFSLFFCKKETC